MKNINTAYHDRRPQKRKNPPREHYTKLGGSWKPKQSFSSEHKAKHWLARHWWMKRRGYNAYLCTVCGKWHVGFLKEDE